MKQLIVTIIVIFPLFNFSQKKTITLEYAVEIAHKKSPDYKTNLNSNQRNFWRFQNYKARFLPQLGLNATLPNYSNSIKRIENDLGESTFVSQNQIITTGGISLSQNVPLTGGTLSVYSNLERVQLFGKNETTRYSVIPFSLRYDQNSLFYNAFKWDKKIEPLVYEESRREFIEKMEDIAIQTCSRYFSLLRAQLQLKIARLNLKNQDTLYQIAKGRYKMGNIAENEVLQMELTYLNSKNSLTQNVLEAKRASQNFSRYLELNDESVTLDIPENLPLFKVDVNKALEVARSNRKAVIQFRRERLEAEKNLAQTKGENRLKMSLKANFGVSQNGNDFDRLFNDFDKQQSVSLSISAPIFDWGVSKSRRKMAEADLNLVKNNIAQNEQAFEQEIYLHVLKWANQRDLLNTAEKAKEVAAKRYEISKKRYVLGKVSVTDLNIALQERDRSVVSYLSALERFWTDYYTLRKLTLYDFIKDEKITFKSEEYY